MVQLETASSPYHLIHLKSCDQTLLGTRFRAPENVGHDGQITRLLSQKYEFYGADRKNTAANGTR
jgi:hypothetical protein